VVPCDAAGQSASCYNVVVASYCIYSASYRSRYLVNVLIYQAGERPIRSSEWRTKWKKLHRYGGLQESRLCLRKSSYQLEAPARPSLGPARSAADEAEVDAIAAAEDEIEGEVVSTEAEAELWRHHDLGVCRLQRGRKLSPIEHSNDGRNGRASAHDDSLLSNQEADAVVEQDTEDNDGEDNAEDVNEDGVVIQPEPRTTRSA
jgi:hypothetical protein